MAEVLEGEKATKRLASFRGWTTRVKTLAKVDLVFFSILLYFLVGVATWRSVVFTMNLEKLKLSQNELDALVSELLVEQWLSFVFVAIIIIMTMADLWSAFLLLKSTRLVGFPRVAIGYARIWQTLNIFMLFAMLSIVVAAPWATNWRLYTSPSELHWLPDFSFYFLLLLSVSVELMMAFRAIRFFVVYRFIKELEVHLLIPLWSRQGV